MPAVGYVPVESGPLGMTVPGKVIHVEDLPTETCGTPSSMMSTLAASVEEAKIAGELDCLRGLCVPSGKKSQAPSIDVFARTAHKMMSRYGLH